MSVIAKRTAPCPQCHERGIIVLKEYRYWFTCGFCGYITPAHLLSIKYYDYGYTLDK